MRYLLLLLASCAPLSHTAFTERYTYPCRGSVCAPDDAQVAAREGLRRALMGRAKSCRSAHVDTLGCQECMEAASREMSARGLAPAVYDRFEAERSCW